MMRRRLVVLAKSRTENLFAPHSRSLSHSRRPSFGIAFDIDGVLLRGKTPIGCSPQSLKRLYDPSGTPRIPYIFLTNGGGIPECKRALELSALFNVNVLPSQVLQGHSPFKQLANRYENKLVLAVGKGEPASVMSAYGFKNVVSIDDYTSCFDNIDPLAPHKKWKVEKVSNESSSFRRDYVCSQRIEAAFIVSDSVDWSRDIQVLCDILRTGGLPGREIELGSQPSLYFAHDDLAYQATFPTERFGMGAFRIALESIFNSIHPNPLQYTSVGKPNPSAFRNAETVLNELYCKLFEDHSYTVVGNRPLETLYMIGDNPSVDIKGARQAGRPWFSILTRTSVFKGNGNDSAFPADMVVDTVEDAVEYILKKEGCS